MKHSFFAAALALLLSGCLGDVVESTPTSAPATTPAVCSDAHASVWYDPTTNIPYIDDATTTISAVTFYLNAINNQAGVYSTTVEARACGPTGSVLGSATVSKSLTPGVDFATTFTFASAIPVQNCGGKGTVAFKFTNNQANPVGVSGQNKSGTSCVVLLGYDATSTPPTNPSGVAVTATITP